MKGKKKKEERIPWKNNLKNTAYYNSHWEIHNLHEHVLGSGNPVVKKSV